MELLNKDQIHTQKNAERLMEIKEGAKLASRVDGLRELASSEEVRLNNFKEENLAIVQAEINIKIEERDTLNEEIRIAKKQLANLRIPLDNEWETVNAKRKVVDDMEADMVIREEKMKADELVIERKIHDLEVEEVRQTDIRFQLTASAEQAAIHLENASKTEEDMKEKEAQMEISYTTREKKLDDREAHIAVRERSLVLREAKVDQDSNDLSLRERQIDDKYQTLIRTSQRVTE